MKFANLLFSPNIRLIDCVFRQRLCRLQTPYYWPSKSWAPENTDYAVYLCKRTMQNKSRGELADYETENLGRLQKMFSRKWEYIFMQAEAQNRDGTERKRNLLSMMNLT